MTAVLLTAFAGEDAQRKLDARISLDLERVTLADAIQSFRDATGLNFVVMDGGDIEISMKIRDVSSRSALRLMLQPRDLSFRFENGAVVIRHRRCDRQATLLRIYDVRGLTTAIARFPAPESPGHFPMVMCGLSVDIDLQPPVVDEHSLAELVRAHTGGRSWDENPGTSLMPRNGLLFVKQTPAVHREIATLLRRLEN